MSWPNSRGLGGVDDLDQRWVGAAIYRQHWHFHRQLLERYGITLAPGEFAMIVSAIRTGKAPLIERKGTSKAIYSVRIPSARQRIYVLTSGGHLISAWPPNKRFSFILRVIQAWSKRDVKP